MGVPSHLLNEIADRLFTLAHVDEGLTRLDQLRLLEILGRISDLHSQIRRCPRMATFVRVRLAYEGLMEEVAWRN